MSCISPGSQWNVSFLRSVFVPMHVGLLLSSESWLYHVYVYIHSCWILYHLPRQQHLLRLQFPPHLPLSLLRQSHLRHHLTLFCLIHRLTTFLNIALKVNIGPKTWPRNCHSYLKKRFCVQQFSFRFYLPYFSHPFMIVNAFPFHRFGLAVYLQRSQSSSRLDGLNCRLPKFQAQFEGWYVGISFCSISIIRFVPRLHETIGLLLFFFFF